MDILKVLFWILLVWTSITLLVRVYWYKKEKYGYASWFFEWLLTCVSCAGVYVVAYNTPLLNQLFWWVAFFAVLTTTLYRVRSKRFREQMAQLNNSQILFVKLLMGLFTLPIAGILLLNATNFTDVWNT